MAIARSILKESPSSGVASAPLELPSAGAEGSRAPRRAPAAWGEPSWSACEGQGPSSPSADGGPAGAAAASGAEGKGVRPEESRRTSAGPGALGERWREAEASSSPAGAAASAPALPQQLAPSALVWHAVSAVDAPAACISSSLGGAGLAMTARGGGSAGLGSFKRAAATAATGEHAGELDWRREPPGPPGRPGPPEATAGIVPRAARTGGFAEAGGRGASVAERALRPQPPQKGAPGRRGPPHE
mmetsp:Transcript_75126/g.220167  ORF Transcript_75126/g.220167 Transcript_75126/m.220167 type:complete len:245 (+) Transcript_75126:151-885(+)